MAIIPVFVEDVPAGHISSVSTDQSSGCPSPPLPDIAGLGVFLGFFLLSVVTFVTSLICIRLKWRLSSQGLSLPGDTIIREINHRRAHNICNYVLDPVAFYQNAAGLAILGSALTRYDFTSSDPHFTLAFFYALLAFLSQILTPIALQEHHQVWKRLAHFSLSSGLLILLLFTGIGGLASPGAEAFNHRTAGNVMAVVGPFIPFVLVWLTAMMMRDVSEWRKKGRFQKTVVWLMEVLCSLVILACTALTFWAKFGQVNGDCTLDTNAKDAWTFGNFIGPAVLVVNLLTIVAAVVDIPVGTRSDRPVRRDPKQARRNGHGRR